MKRGKGTAIALHAGPMIQAFKVPISTKTTHYIAGFLSFSFAFALLWLGL